MSFDRLLNKTCSVMERVQGDQDSHGNRPTTWNPVPVEANVPCRVSSLRSRPREFLAGKNLSDDYVTVLMRPRAFALTEHHNLLMDDGRWMNIVQVLPMQGSPDGLDAGALHHLEVYVQVVKP